MDYDEWTPLGRGDPLKNDPTFDYSPPMVSKVKYWINPLFRTPDPPIVPLESTTESGQYTATTVGPTTPSKSSGSLSKQPSSDIKRFYVDFKDPSDMTYVQLMNSRYSNKLTRPPLQYQQNHYYNPTRQPPAPLPMLIPPPPVEPSSYSSTKIENSTALELSWDIRTHSTASTGVDYLTSTTPMIVETYSTAKTAPNTDKFESKIQSFKTTTSDKSILQNLLGKEKSDARATSPTTLKPLTPHPVPYYMKQSVRPIKTSSYLIIQGHSKVKKYGASSLDRSDMAMQDTNEINDAKFELPKDVRERKQLNVEDFLPFNGIFSDFISSQAEGSGLGAELTKAMFPSYVKPSTTLQYDSPRFFEYSEENGEEA